MLFKVYEQYCGQKFYLTIRVWPSARKLPASTDPAEAAIFDSATPLGREWLNGHIHSIKNMNIEKLDGTRWIHPAYREGAK